jgi:hypothetical protein
VAIPPPGKPISTQDQNQFLTQSDQLKISCTQRTAEVVETRFVEDAMANNWQAVVRNITKELTIVYYQAKMKCRWVSGLLLPLASIMRRPGPA